jgi:hypothetical protein
MLNSLVRTLRLVPLAAALACGSQAATPLAITGYTLQQAADSIPLPYRTDVRVGDVWMSLGDEPSDSRCPTGVACVWAGDAVAAITVHPGCYKEGCAAPSTGLTLHTTLDPKEGDALGYHVRLLALRPEPARDTTIDPARYVAWVRVSP